ncbi:hypothetical protein ABW19_dt0200866 [Dactylella cylindrospora]|nr:hypothetical protein ABW19_dt0200866 [Dactylella cylindrospora]
MTLLITFSLTLLFRLASPHEVSNIELTDSLSSSNCKAPAFRFFQNSTLVLNQLIPSDPTYSTCSWHDDMITAVEMCGAPGTPYQCAVYLDNTCGNGDIEHDGTGRHTNLSDINPDVRRAYRILFSDPNDEWVKVSWDEHDQTEVINSYHCIPSTAEEFSLFTGEGKGEPAVGGSESGSANPAADVASTRTTGTSQETTTNSVEGSLGGITDPSIGSKLLDTKAFAIGWLLGMLIGVFIFL